MAQLGTTCMGGLQSNQYYVEFMCLYAAGCMLPVCVYCVCVYCCSTEPFSWGCVALDDVSRWQFACMALRGGRTLLLGCSSCERPAVHRATSLRCLLAGPTCCPPPPPPPCARQSAASYTATCRIRPALHQPQRAQPQPSLLKHWLKQPTDLGHCVCYQRLNAYVSSLLQTSDGQLACCPCLARFIMHYS